MRPITERDVFAIQSDFAMAYYDIGLDLGKAQLEAHRAFERDHQRLLESPEYINADDGKRLQLEAPLQKTLNRALFDAEERAERAKLNAKIHAGQAAGWAVTAEGLCAPNGALFKGEDWSMLPDNFLSLGWRQ